MLEEIRLHLGQVPFVPFHIRMSDGRSLEVRHPDFVWMPKPGVVLFFHEQEGASERLNVLHILGVSGQAKAQGV